MPGNNEKVRRPFIIAGTSGFAVELYDLVRSSDYPVLGFAGPPAGIDLPAPCLADDDAVRQAGDAVFLIAIGDPSLRRQVAESLRVAGARFATYVDPHAYVAETAILGEGTIVYPHATVHARVRLGNFCVVNSNTTIGHECWLGDFVTLSPGCALGGRVRIGTDAFIGIGAAVIQGIEINAGVVVGASAAVVRDLLEPGTYVGVPARRQQP